MKTRFLSFVTALSITLTLTLMFPQFKASAEVSKSDLSLNDSIINSCSASDEIKFKQVSLGAINCAAVTTTGDLYMWGDNLWGQLGNYPNTSSYTPVKIMSNVSYVDQYNGDIYAITENKDLYRWGHCVSGNTPEKILNNIHSIKIGSSSAAIAQNGDLFVWGYYYDKPIQDYLYPQKIMSNILNVEFGFIYTATINTNNDLYMWGYNHDGQIGDGTTIDSYVPIKIMDNVSSVDVFGSTSSAAITTNSDLYMWGLNDVGQLGDGTRINKIIPTKIMSNIAIVDTADKYSAAITTSGDLYMWGNNNHGQIGDGTTIDSDVPKKIMSNVSYVNCAYDNSAAITANGDLYMWGSNGYGQLGDGTRTNKTIPTKIMSNIAIVDTADKYSAAITTSGDLYMWGCNDYGLLGNGTTESSNVPIKVEISNKTDDGEDDFVGEATNNIGTQNVLCGDFINVDFSSIISPLYPTSFDSYEVISSDSSVAEIVNTYDYTNGTEPLRYVSSKIRTKNEGTANINCKFTNAVVGNKKLKEYTLFYTVNATIFSKDVSLEVWSETLGKKKISIDFPYSDELFFQKSTEYNYELSKLSSVMAMSAYWDSNKDNRYAKNNLEKLDFENIDDYGSYAKLENMTESDCHYVGYTFATKDIYIDGQKNTVIAVIIKGTSSNEEWYSNFDVYEHENLPLNRHFGFAFANAKMEKDFNEYISKLNIDYSNTKIWIAGHSRGAGVGNLFAADIIAEGKFLQSNVFAYLYAPPAVEKNINIKYENIFNFINPQDFVPRMPLQSWNYKRYGNDYIFPNKVTNDFNMWVEYENEIRRVFYNLFGESVKPYFFKNGTGNTVLLCNHLYNYCNDTKSFYHHQKFVVDLMDNGNIIQKEYYCSFYDYFRKGIAAAAGPNVLSGIEHIAAYMFEPYSKITGYFVGGTIGLNSNTIDSLISGSGLYRPVVYSHTPEMYIAWAYVCDSVNDFKDNFYVEGIISCPVDIEVYDSHNNLVGRVVNNKVDESVTKLEILVDEETSTKTVFMPASEQFTVKAVGYDNGTMDYSIELCDIIDLSTSDLRSVEDIEITPNTTVTTNTDLSGNVLVTAVTNDGNTLKTVEYTIDQNNIVTTETTTTGDSTPSTPDDSDNDNSKPSFPPNSSSSSNGGNTNTAPTTNSSDIESFSVKVENKVTGKTKKIRAVRNGENVTVDVGKENNGYYANIYTNYGEFITAVLIEKGNVRCIIPKNIKFNIVIDEYSYVEDVSSAAGIYEIDNNSQTPIYIILIIFAALGFSYIIITKRLKHKC